MVKNATAVNSMNGEERHAICNITPESQEDPPTPAPPDSAPPTPPPAGHNDLIYTVEDVPPWYLCLFFGLQHYLTMAGGTVGIPIMVASFLCMAEDDPARSALVSTVLFHSGLVTLLQTTFGIRLPVVQGGDFAYVVPTITLLTSIHPPCAALPLANMTAAAREEEWLGRIRDVQGAIAVASVFQIVLGFSGLVGVLLRFITPLAIAPTVALVGLSLFDVAASKASSHWGISFMTMAFMILFSQYLSRVEVPVPVVARGGRGLSFGRARFFKCFPVLGAVLLSWGVCGVLTALEFFPPGSPARTDAAGDIIRNTPWIFVPYPGQWGWPSVTAAGVVGMLGGAVASMTESIGDYYACAQMAGAPPPPRSAINRGIAVEGLGCLLAGLLGTGNGTTSCSQNIGVISVTKVGSRRVVQFSALILIASGVFGKCGAFFVTIPEPVVAGVFIIMFAMISAVGLSALQDVDLASSRNIFILGYSLFLGLLLPKWLAQHPEALRTGSEAVDQMLRVLLQTPMVVGGVTGGLLDNTIPGTAEERGLTKRNKHLQRGKEEAMQALRSPTSVCYDLPWITPYMRRVSWMRFLPFSPTFDEAGHSSCMSSRCKDEEEQDQDQDDRCFKTSAVTKAKLPTDYRGEKVM
ncbi:solute carrier family 23 member 1-like [Eriocheir sinensis]|uniref:solute carrier family 23 member 1-like n=1 Tax=Eriocheir sinensis TaxID=95602 RepID=UPI0021C71AB4|nr:solute carrier family 23 member 1-like [Eriocheir sinensis]